MNIGNIMAMSNKCYNSTTPIDKGNTSEFVIPKIDEQEPESGAVSNNNPIDPLSTMESMTGKAAINESRNPVTDEDIKYFREKYGDMYNENTVGELYYELADKGIISINDACSSSGEIALMPLSAVKKVIYFGTYLPGSEYIKPLRSFSDLTNDVAYIKDISRTEKGTYKPEWDRFEAEYDSNTNTWKDALQKSIDFERYLKEIAKSSTSEKHYPSQWRLDSVIESLEKTKDVISQIFD